MKRIKHGVAVVFLFVIVYCAISSIIFFIKKPSIDLQIQGDVSPGSVQPEQVIIQMVPFAPKGSDDNVCKDEILTQQGSSLATALDDDNQEFLVSEDFLQDAQMSMSPEPSQEQKTALIDSYSFLTFPIDADYVIDEETHFMIDNLIGKDLDAFVKLILQSNNNILSKEACRSCSMYAFFKKIKNNKPLTTNEIRILQKTVLNLSDFLVKMRKISKTKLITAEQSSALVELSRSQATKNDMKLQARKAATYDALKKLQAIKYNR